MTTATIGCRRSASACALAGACYLQRRRSGAVVAPRRGRQAVRGGTTLRDHLGHRAATLVGALITSREGPTSW